MKSEIKSSPFSSDKRPYEPLISLKGRIPDNVIDEPAQKKVFFQYEQDENEIVDTPVMAKNTHKTSLAVQPQCQKMNPVQSQSTNFLREQPLNVRTKPQMTREFSFSQNP